MRRNNQLPPLPQELQAAQQQGAVRLRIRFEGPLARAQKSVNISAYQALLNTMAPLMQAHPQVMDVIDWDEVVRDAAITLGIAPKAVRDADQVNQVRAEQVQAQQQQNGPQEMAEGAGKAAPMVKALGAKPDSGSPLGNMMQNAQNSQNGIGPQNVSPQQS
jgi:tRNA G10  N-methylase Trm11